MFLKSLWALRSSHWPRDVISQEKPLIELCCVLHRQLVTRCDIKIQKLVIDVLRVVIERMRENFNKIAEKEDDKDPAGTEKELNSEEEATGEELQASPSNKYVVMSVLEVVFCLLMPNISTHNSYIFVGRFAPSARIEGLLYPSINTFQQAYQKGNEQVTLKAVGLIAQVFEKADRSVSTCFIHAMAPRILQFLYGEEAKNVRSKGMLEFILESLRAIQILVQLVDSWAKCTLKSGVQMLTLIVPVLINFLVEPHLVGMPMTGHRKLLHDESLQKLMKIGLQYREEFRALMGQCTEMRVKLETVIKNSKSLTNHQWKRR
ncbi:HEAT repeat-containing protein 5B [Orchesella cincta]|uniref:HEAT repeat-containing protein 5B n=1 Tax=Orchesella cincta TaxID=48709 RepID=A0A1D2M7X0_ORCCI|nr:HEAT repeat-containing protein 5B [Orchesella cincta]